MTIFRSMVTNTAARTVTELINRGGSAIFWIVLARYLGASGLGSFAFGLSMYGLFTVISTLGLNSVVVRDVARNHKDAGKYFGHTLLLGSVAAGFMAVAMMLTSALLKPSADTLTVCFWMSIALIPTAGFYWSRAILTAAEKMVYIALARVAENAFKIAFGISIIVGGLGVREVAIIIMLSKVVSFVLCFHFAIRHVAPPSWKIEKAFLSYLLKQAPSFFMISIFNGLFWSVTVIMLTKLRGEAEAGIFSAAMKIVDICVSFAAAYGAALFPIGSRVMHSSPAVFANLFKKSIKYLLIVTTGIATTLAIMSPDIIRWLFDVDLIGAAPILRTLVWILVPYSLIPIYAYTLINNHQQTRDLMANLLGTMTLIIGNFVFINLYGAMGAAAVMLLGTIVFFITEFFWVEKEIIRVNVSMKTALPVLGLLVMAFVVFTLKGLQPVVAVIAGLLVYLSFLWVTDSISDFEDTMIRHMKSNL